MNFTKLIMASLLLGSLLLIACGTSDVAAPTLPSNWHWYNNSQHGYRVGYPDAWGQNDTSTRNMTSFFDRETGVGVDIGVATTRQTDLKSYVEINKISSTEGATYLSQGPTTINGIKAYELVLTLPSSFFGPNFEPGLMKHRQIAILSNGKAYILTATALDSEYKDYVDIFDTVINSFLLAE